MADIMSETTVRQRRTITTETEPAPQNVHGHARAHADDETTDMATNGMAGGKASGAPKKKRAARRPVDDEDDYSPWVDVLRVLTFLLVASCGLSYLVSGGDSWFWYYGQVKPSWMRIEHWKAKFSGPVTMTLEELAQYDGTDPEKPIYLAINGTIYDVSTNRRTYGPGGSYQYFAGRDASRAYVTGCFFDDRTPDMRGVEEMFLPLEDPEVNKHFAADELRALRERERREARQKVHDALKHWVDFFANSPKYPMVGRVNRPKGWLKTQPRRKLCEQAEKSRVPRQIPEGK